MLAKILVDNHTRNEWKAEWGLAVYIEYCGHKILLDAGTTHVFAENAEMMFIGACPMTVHLPYREKGICIIILTKDPNGYLIVRI